MTQNETRLASSLRAGVSRVVITPPVGAMLTGFFTRATGSVGVRDPLYATALVVESGGSRVALLGCDLLWVHPSLVAEVRAGVEEATGIPGANVMICCSHTHSGPPGYIHPNARSVDNAYVAVLRYLLIGAVAAAARELRPVTLHHGVSACAAAINRREVRPDGRVVLGHNPTGPRDALARVARLDRADGRPLVSIINYACHPVTLGPASMEISSDWVCHMRSVVEGALGGSVLFVQGTCGDVNPRLGPAADEGQTQIVGLEVAGAVLQASATAQPATSHGVAAATAGLVLPLMEDISAIPDLMSDGDRRAITSFVDQRIPWAAEVVDNPAGGGQAVPIELQALRIGGLRLVGLPMEPFSAIGLALRESPPGGMIMPAGYANGCVGYVPTADAYALGGYEVATSFAYFRLPRPLAPQCAQLVIAQGLRLLQQVAG